MYQLNTLVNKINKKFEEFNLKENIDIRISSNKNFEFQINNLVKYQTHKDIESLSLSISDILKNEELIDNFEITESKFINLKIAIDKFIFTLENIDEIIKVKNPKKIIIDYGGPNIGKPLHVGHLRSLNIGRSLYEINKIAGNDVLSDIHMGDWGMPIAQIISFIKKYKIDINTIEISDLENIYPKASKNYAENDEFREISLSINKKLNHGDKDTISEWKIIKNLSIESIKETLNLLDHDFDLWKGESDVNSLIPSMLDNLKKDKKISLDKGAYISNLDTDPKILITKSDGSYLYLTTDLATVLNRLDENKVDKVLYVVDKRQKLHFEQLISSIKYFEFGNEAYQHVPFGTVNDANGNPFRTREGDTKKLFELFNETFEYIKKINKNLDDRTTKLLANTVLTYSDLITNRMTDYKFDLDKFSNISGKTGIYVQYAHVRAKKLVIKANLITEDLNLNISDFDATDLSLIRSLLKFEMYFDQALNNNEPHHLADYLYELSNLFNSMYQNKNILENKNENIKKNKIKLTYYFLIYSELLMKSLGIKPVDKM